MSASKNNVPLSLLLPWKILALGFVCILAQSFHARAHGLCVLAPHPHRIPNLWPPKLAANLASNWGVYEFHARGPWLAL